MRYSIFEIYYGFRSCSTDEVSIVLVAMLINLVVVVVQVVGQYDIELVDLSWCFSNGGIHLISVLIIFYRKKYLCILCII